MRAGGCECRHAQARIHGVLGRYQVMATAGTNEIKRSIGFINWAHALDHYVMLIFYAGCGLSLVAAGLAPNLIVLGIALTALGVFAAIYHPVGTAMLIEQATLRGRSLAFNGVCGNLGAALAAGTTAALVARLGWRAAFLVPGAVCVATAVVYLRLVPDEARKAASRGTVADVPLGAALAATIFGLFIVIALCAGLVFNIVSVALPKIVDERLGADVPL